MPKVPGPGDVRRVGLRGGSTGVPGSLAVAGQVGEAVAGLGRDISGVGDVAARVGAAQQRKDDETYINSRVNAFEKDASSIARIELDKRGGATVGARERARKEYDDKINSYLENEDPRYADILRARYEIKANHRWNQIAAHEGQQRVVWEKEVDVGVILTQRNNAFEDPLSLPIYLGAAKNSLGDRYTDQNRSDIVAAAIDGMLLEDPVTAKKFYAEVRDVMAVDHKKFYDKKIDDTIDAAEKEAKRKANEVRGEAKEKKRGIAEAWEQEAVGRYENLTIPEVKAAPISAARKRVLINDIEKRAEKRAKGEKDPFKVTDKKVEAELTNRIYEDPTSISDADIRAKIGHGIGVDVGQEILRLRKTVLRAENEPLSRAVGRAKIRLNTAKRSGHIDPETWGKMNTELDAGVSSGKLEKPREVDDYITKELAPYARGKLEKLADAFIDFIGFKKEKQVVRTGTRGDGTRVVEYDDGTVGELQ
jgi:hypothetical protein